MKGSSRKYEFFTSRWGMILSLIGVAIGTGNIWRFSRIVAQNGGGSFLIPWVIFLLIWSIPLIIAEIGIGKHTRYGPVGAFIKMAGERFAWMGAFVGFVSTAIMFYYTVVAGWCIRYFFKAISGDLVNPGSNFMKIWNSFAMSYEPLLWHMLAMSIGAFIIYRGVVSGIEKTNKILIPLLLLILITLAIRAITLPGAIEGIKYFFTPDIKTLLDYKVWLQALTQNAWDTGAGWGLFLTYAVYARKKEDIALNSALTAFGNNSISLLAGITIFSTVFALSPDAGMKELIEGTGSTNTGLAFIFLPELFSRLPGGIFIQTFFSSIFFLGLSLAAITSLISMIELVVRVLMDMGVERKKAIIYVATAGFTLGIPSALNLNFLNNQDWTWGVALLISGGFIAFAVIKFDVEMFRTEVINAEGRDIKINKIFNFIIKYIIPLEVIILVLWWLYSSTQWDERWWNPFGTYTLGTCIFQWLFAIAIFIAMNKFFVLKLIGKEK